MFIKRVLLTVLAVLALAGVGMQAKAVPASGALAILSSNRHYFEDAAGNPMVLVGDYTWTTFSAKAPTYSYLCQFDMFQAKGINFGRIWLVAGNEYNSDEGCCGVTNYMPWNRTGPGTAHDGGLKFDLYSFNQEFFDRAKALIQAAKDRGIFCHLMIFDCWMIKTDRWPDHAFDGPNNINGVDADVNNDGVATGSGEFCSTSNTNVYNAQKAFLRKLIDETNQFDNIYYEIANENFYDASWELALCDYIQSYEAGKPKQHLVMPKDLPSHSNVVQSFDHATVHSTMLSKQSQNKPLINDTDFTVISDDVAVRKCSWAAVATGGHYDYMDDTLSECHCGACDGSVRAAVHDQIGYLGNFARSLKPWNMTPSNSFVVSGTAYAMAGSVEMAAYFPNGGSATLNLGGISGALKYQWYNTRTGAWSAKYDVTGGANRSFTAADSNDWGLRIWNPSGDTQAPSTPANVAAVTKSYSSIQVTWTASTDNVGVIGYNIYRNGSLAGSSTSTVYIDMGLQGSTTYSYKVSAYDWAGNESAQSSPAAVATTLAVPTYCTADLGSANVWELLTLAANSDGDTTSSTTDGLDCRKPVGTGDQYYYFRIDDSFIYNGSNPTTYLEINYYDDQSSTVYIQPQYDSTSAAYTSASNVNLGNTAKWKTATWTLTNCKFANSQNVGADFRIYVGAYSVKIDSVRVSKIPWTDYTTVERDLGSSEAYRGLSHPQPSDGDTVLATVGGRECRKCSVSGDNYMYFNVSDAIIYNGSPATVYLKVVYYDSSGGMIQPQYDATGGAYTNATTLNFTGTNTWKEATWTLSSARFANNQSGSADLRLNVGTSQNVYIDKVYVSKQPFTADTTPPSVPTGVTATAQSQNSILVSWTASTDNFGVAGYKVYRNGSQVGTSGTTSYTDTGLTPSTTYSYTVSAYDGANNNSAPSSPAATATTFVADTQAPSVPTGVTATAQSSTSILVAWTASTDNVGVTGYKVYRNGGQVGTPATTSYTDTGLNPSTTYSYTVSAYDAANNNSAQSSPPATATTPYEFTITNVVPSGYQVATLDIGSTHFTDRSYTITDMPSQYRGLLGVRTANNDKDNPSLDFHFTINNSAEIYVCMSGSTQPTTPLLTGFVDTGDDIVSTDSTPTYSVFHKVYPAGLVSLGPKPGAGNGYSMFFVLAKPVPDTTPPSVPSNVAATPLSETSIQVSWTASTDNIAVTGYKVYRNGSQVGTSVTTSYTDTGLAPKTTYSYKVSAYDASGNNSAQSSPAATATTPDNTSPSVPSNVQALAKSPSVVQVSWSASTDNVGVTGYKVFRGGSQVGTCATTSYTDMGLAPGTTYSYTVSAYDAANNNSAQSSPAATATTMAAINIAEAKELSNGLSVGFVSKVVTAIFSGNLYIEESDRRAGIKVVPVEMPGDLAVGSLVDVGGMMQTANGERYVGEATVGIR